MLVVGGMFYILHSGIVYADEKSDFKIFKSKSEISRLIKNKGLSLNKVKIESEEYSLLENIKYNKYILLQKGKKNYTFIIVE